MTLPRATKAPPLQRFCRRLASLGLAVAAALQMTGVAGAVVIGGDDRRPIVSADQNAATAATGLLVCGRSVSTAQLVEATDVIITAAHVFYRDRFCRRGDLRGCFFRLANGRDPTRYRLDPMSLKTAAGCSFSDPKLDWAVVKLVKPVPLVEPYRVFRGQPLAGSRIIQISAVDRSFVVEGVHRRAIQACRIKEFGEEGLLKTDCDTGTGSSGAAQLTIAAPAPQIVALNVGQASAALDGHEYNADWQYNVSISLSGAFLDAIQALATGSGTGGR